MVTTPPVTPLSGIAWTSGTDDRTANTQETSTSAAQQSGGSWAPVTVRKTDANITLAVNAAYQDLDTGGTATARPLDIVIPNAAAGQWVSVCPSFLITSSTIAMNLDCFTIVAASPVHQFTRPGLALSTTGVANWGCSANAVGIIGGAVSYQLAANDIENGSVRLRFRTLQASGAARLLFSGGGGTAIAEGRGPFG